MEIIGKEKILKKYHGNLKAQILATFDSIGVKDIQKTSYGLLLLYHFKFGMNFFQTNFFHYIVVGIEEAVLRTSEYSLPLEIAEDIAELFSIPFNFLIFIITNHQINSNSIRQ
jgi:hypothetical protein